MWQGTSNFHVFNLVMVCSVVVGIGKSMDHALLQRKTDHVAGDSTLSEAPQASAQKSRILVEAPKAAVHKSRISSVKASVPGRTKLSNLAHVAHPIEATRKTGKESERGPGALAQLNEEGYRHIALLKNNKQMETYIRRVVKNMSLEVVDDARLKGVVPFYSGRKAKQTLANLQREITESKVNACDSWVMQGGMAKNYTGFTAPLDEEGYFTIARKHNDSEMEKFIEREIYDLNYEITDVSGLLGLSPFHSCAKGTKSFAALQKELLTLAATPGKWVRLKGTASHAKSSGPQPHSADTTLKREEFAKKMNAKREASNQNFAKEKEQIKKTTDAKKKAMHVVRAKDEKNSKDSGSPANFILQGMQPVGSTPQQQHSMANAQSGSCTATFQEMHGADVADFDISGESESELDSKCCSACSANSQCDFWVRENESRGTVICWLKKNREGNGPVAINSRRGGWNKAKLLVQHSAQLSNSQSKMQQEASTMKAAREAYDQKLEQKEQMSFTKAARKAHDKKTDQSVKHPRKVLH